jgi:hypothetical protein
MWPFASFLTRRLRALKSLQEGFDMTIFGVALLAFCTLVGVFVGDLLGIVLGVKANVGGVGLAMMLLMAAVALIGHIGRDRQHEIEAEPDVERGGHVIAGELEPELTGKKA